MKKKSSIRPFVMQFFRGNALRMAVAGMELLTSVVSSLLVAWLIQQIMDLIAGYDTGYTLQNLAWIACGCISVQCISSVLGYFSRPHFITRGIAQYKGYAFREITKKNLSAFSGENSSLYISALSNDAKTIETDLLANLVPIFENTLLFIGALVMMFLYSPMLTVISIALSFLPILASVLVGDRAAKAGKKVSDANAVYIATLKDALTGFSVIKSFQAESQICGIFEESLQKLTAAKSRKRKITIVVQMLGSAAGIVAQLGVFLVGAYLALTGKGVTVGTVMVFVQMMNYVIGPLAAIPTYLAKCKTAVALIQKLADALPENVRTGGIIEKDNLNCCIAVNDLSFGYDAKMPVLHDINLTFDAGKSYAIVGGSGSGKSTLLHLLMASSPNYTGSISFDGTEVTDIQEDSLYGMLSIIQQNVFIFNASIRDNITMFSKFADTDIDRAIELSGLSELIAERGTDYLCGENGNKLSGGEKQRIAIARSLLHKSSILLVDEATAALDVQTAYQVTTSILGLENITRIVVTHALDENLLKQYDGIVTLKAGQIVETGTFQELMGNRGYFYSLYTVSQ